MKTAISVPDDTYERVTRQAKSLGMSRSELFARAAERFLDQLEARSLSTQIDAALDHLGPMDESSASAIAAGRRALGDGDDW